VRAVTSAVILHLRRAPDLLIVQGDTSSALGGALAGFSAGVPVAHVEAGLRSHDASMPWPEEEYRVAIDARADLLFAPTQLAAANLRAERVPGAVFVTGNTSIDALLKVTAGLPPPSLRNTVPRLLASCHRRENWNDGLGSVASALVELGQDGACSVDVLLHPNLYLRRRMEELLGGRANIALVPPCRHRDLVARMRECDLMLSDSGGVQEEAPALGLPLLVLREKTERPEAIATGNMMLVGTDAGRIVDSVRELLADPAARAAMARPCLPYGDGQAGPRIAGIIERFLGAAAQKPNLRTG
jgi:UDP-N-acetylglucosamine 2-epimerase (non-hydrolysing)